MKKNTKVDNHSPGSSRTSAIFLLLGALTGALLAATGLIQPVAAPNDEKVLAEVNGWSIRSSDFDRFISSLERGKQSALGFAERKNLLDRMIEEKLILQRGIELGLVENDASVRKAISTAMLQTITAEVSAIEPDENDLVSFYRDNASYFAQAARLRVQQLIFLNKGDSKRNYSRAAAAYDALLNGESIERVQSSYADKAVLDVPDVLLPPHKLRDYIGPKLVDLAMTMQSGQFSKPMEQQGAYVILIVHDNEPQSNFPLASIRERVVNEYQRRAGEQALREYLDMLRAEADIVISPHFRENQDSPMPLNNAAP